MLFWSALQIIFQDSSERVLNTDFVVCVSLIHHKSKYCVDNGDPSGQSTEVDQKSFKTRGDT